MHGQQNLIFEFKHVMVSMCWTGIDCVGSYIGGVA
jgi:hypothetical protein